MPSRIVIGALVLVVVVAALVSAATASFMMSALPREQESVGRSRPCGWSYTSTTRASSSEQRTFRSPVGRTVGGWRS